MNDAENLYEYAKDPQIGPACGWPVHTDIENSREIIKTVLSDTNSYAVYFKQENKVIGSIGLRIGEKSPLGLASNEGELGCWIGIPFWGQGLMFEAMKTLIDYAFKSLHLKKLHCSYFEGNEKSKRLQEKCGFQYKYSQIKEYSLLHENKTIHINSLCREKWEKEEADFMIKGNFEYLGLINTDTIYYNLSPAQLTEKALERQEGILSDTGALVITTGKYTGRSPDDKFIVDTPEIHNSIAWGDVNYPIDRKAFQNLYQKVLAYLQRREIFVFDGFAGADPQYRKNFRFINECASQNLFIHQLLIRPTEEELKNYGEPDFTIISAPNFTCIPEVDGVNSEVAIIIDFEARLGIICGTIYSGELKKMVFSIMNYLMPKEGVLPMHCSANLDPETGNTAIFFGLSGTGKTTLSADPNRMLIGDDEHGWSPHGVFNFEGGCYAKCINLSEETEPDIYHAIKFGSIVENVVIDTNSRNIDYFNNYLTQNTRVAYPLHYIRNAQFPSVGGIPNVIIFLTADSFGVLPPISKLTKEAAMYHFITGFTAKLAGTERGVKEPVPTFSTCFGEPFMPMDPSVYAKMLGEKIEEYNTQVYLINTGWTGGPYGVGNRMNLTYTRAMITAVLNGSMNSVEYAHNKIFNVEVPLTCPEVPSNILNPINTWDKQEEYTKAANALAKKFQDNFASKYPNISQEIVDAGPKAE